MLNRFCIITVCFSVFLCSYSMQYEQPLSIKDKELYRSILAGNVYPTGKNIDDINFICEKFPSILKQNVNVLNMIYHFDAGNETKAEEYFKRAFRTQEGIQILEYWKDCSKLLKRELVDFIDKQIIKAEKEEISGDKSEKKAPKRPKNSKKSCKGSKKEVRVVKQEADIDSLKKSKRKDKKQDIRKKQKIEEIPVNESMEIIEDN